ncbi:NucT-like nuclease [Arthrobacter phage Brynnie]|nr:NucT-like nuclease [Arthrobacter phage Brynnie]
MADQKFRTGDELPLFEAPELDSNLDGVRVLERKRPGVRRHRMLRTNSARVALAPFKPGHDYEVMTNGAFSLLDAVLVLLEKSGPADVSICTYSAGLYDAEVMNRFVETGNVRSIRLVLDGSIKTLGGTRGYAVTLMDVFGEECIRTTRTHAKFVTITNDEHTFTISSTANLNENKRLELFYFSDDPDRAAFYEAVVDEVFHDVKPGWNPDHGAPGLGRLDPTGSAVATSPRSGVSMGHLGIN